MADVFISYSRKDKEFGIKLHDALTSHGKDTFIDLRDIPPAADFLDEIYFEIENAIAFVFVISPDSVISEACRLEIEHAKKHNKRFVPIVRRDVGSKPIVHLISAEESPSSETSSQSPSRDRIERLVPTPLEKLNWIFFREEDDFASALTKLIKAIETDLDWVKAHTRLEKRAIEWNSKKHNDAYVLRGRDLREAEEWQAQAVSGKEPKPTALQGEYILTSRKSAIMRRTITICAVASALAITCLLSVFGLFQLNQVANESIKRAAAESTKVAEVNARATAQVIAENSSKESLSRELASAAIDILKTDPGLGLLLAIESASAYQTSEAEDALRQSLLTSHARAVMRGHTGAVDYVAFSLDSKFVLTVSEDNTARVWEVATGRNVAVLRGHTGHVHRAAFSPDGRYVITASEDSTARVWESATGKNVYVWRGQINGVNSAAFNPNGKWAVTASGDKTAQVWEVATGKIVSIMRGHAELVNSAEFSPDGRYVVTASFDKTARVWEAATGRSVAELRGHKFEPNSASFSPDSKFVITASGDNTARIWEALSGRSVIELKGHTNAVKRASFSPDGKWVVTASFDNTARVWEVATGKIVSELRGHQGGVVSATFSPDGKWVLTASWDSTARVWEAATGRIAFELRGHRVLVTSAAFSPDGKFIATAGYGDHTARVWAARTAQIPLEIDMHSDEHSGWKSATFNTDRCSVANIKQ